MPGMRIIRLLLASGALACLAGGAAHGQPNVPRKLAAMTPADVGARVRVADDPLERHVVISTDGAFRGSRPVEGGLEGQAHLRAVIDRASGAVRFEVRQETAYSGPRKQLYQVNYLAGGRLVEAELALAVHETDDCPQVDMIGSCVLAKTVAFELPEPLVREIAAQYQPGARTPWAYRIKDRNGKDVTGGIAPVEASGLLEALASWRARNLTPAPDH